MAPPSTPTPRSSAPGDSDMTPTQAQVLQDIMQNILTSALNGPGSQKRLR